MAEQSVLRMLDDPVAQQLLRSTIPARLAYIGLDGAPRVVPIWFHWSGQRFVLGTSPGAPKVKALARNAKVALTIDEDAFPPKVLLVRGTAAVSMVEGLVPEYAEAALRYLGDEQGRAWQEQARGMFQRMARIAIEPEWVKILDFQTRFPSAVEAAMRGGG
jgi:hypothetical protein